MVPYVERQVELCRFFDRCLPEGLDVYAGRTVEDCIDFERCSAPDEDWVVSEKCIQAMRNADCDVDWVRMIHLPPCQIGGSLPPAREGEACHYDVCRADSSATTRILCDDGLVCDDDDICVPVIPAGEPCKIDLSPGAHVDRCEDGSFCDGSSCREYLREGEDCSLIDGPDGELDPCPIHWYCTDGVCVETEYAPFRDLGEGEACEPDEERCHHGLTCSKGQCAPVGCPGEEGDLCDAGTCGPDLLCNRERNRCEPPGVDCYDDQTGDYLKCADGLVCSEATDTCQLPG